MQPLYFFINILGERIAPLVLLSDVAQKKLPVPIKANFFDTLNQVVRPIFFGGSWAFLRSRLGFPFHAFVQTFSCQSAAFSCLGSPKRDMVCFYPRPRFYPFIPLGYMNSFVLYFRIEV